MGRCERSYPTLTVMMDELYLFLASNGSIDYYPNNSPAHFSVKLPETIHLSGGGPWMCALQQFQCKTRSPTNLYVFCDALEDSFALCRKLPLLQRIPRQVDNRVVQSFDASLCFKVTRHALNTITVYTRDAQLETLSFAEEPTNCTLHFFRKES